jgi:hypothetical protein
VVISHVNITVMMAWRTRRWEIPFPLPGRSIREIDARWTRDVRNIQVRISVRIVRGKVTVAAAGSPTHGPRYALGSIVAGLVLLGITISGLMHPIGGRRP